MVVFFVECFSSFKIVLVMYFLEWLYSDSEDEEDELDDPEDEEELLLLGLLQLWLLFFAGFFLELLFFNES